MSPLYAAISAGDSDGSAWNSILLCLDDFLYPTTFHSALPHLRSITHLEPLLDFGDNR